MLASASDMRVAGTAEADADGVAAATSTAAGEAVAAEAEAAGPFEAVGGAAAAGAAARFLRDVLRRLEAAVGSDGSTFTVALLLPSPSF